MMLGQLTTSRSDLKWAEDELDWLARVRPWLAKLDRAVTSVQVAKVVVEAGMTLGHATSGALALLTGDPCELKVIHAVGPIAETVRPNLRLPLGTNSPLADAVRSHSELWLADPREFNKLSGLGASA
jgi:hypothetical protein